MSILIQNGKVWDGERFSCKDIWIEGDKIKKIDSQISENADFVYDAAGKIVSAGLVDAHVHMRGISPERFGIQAEMSCFPFGATAANDAWGMNGDEGLLDSFMLKSTVFIYVDIRNNHACLEPIESMRLRYGDRAIGLKLSFDRANSQLMDITPLREVCAYAQQNALKVMVHCNGSPAKMCEIIDVLNPGDILTHAFHGGNNTAEEDDFACIQLAKKRGIFIDAGMAGNVHTDFRIMQSAISRGILPDIISTDITRSSGYIRGGRYGLTMCMNIARELGMQEEAIFQAVTSAPAKALGKADVWGFLKEGRCADLAVIDCAKDEFALTDKAGNTVKATNGYRCVLTISDGQIVYRE